MPEPKAEKEHEYQSQNPWPLATLAHGTGRRWDRRAAACAERIARVQHRAATGAEGFHGNTRSRELMHNNNRKQFPIPPLCRDGQYFRPARE